LDGLARVRYTRPQVDLSAIERRTNLTEAFLWESRTPPPERIILVDDVFTTGSTMQECARELKRHGAKWVWGLTLARG
jgi:predicted amidophosphoribosyltransferase